MKNKPRYIIVLSILAVVLIFETIFIIIAPSSVPMHYNIAGQIDRYGSKFEMLMFPILVLISGFLSIIFARRYKNREDFAAEKLALNVGIIITILFTAIDILFSVIALTPDFQYDYDFYKLIFVILGVMFIALCNIMPKSRINSLFGIRTSWSVSNEKVWQKSQRFGGYSGVIVGILMILSGIVLPIEFCIAMCLAAVLVWAILSTVMSYVYFKRFGQFS